MKPASIAPATAAAILDRAAQEAKGRVLGDVLEVLLPSGVGELVEHRHLVAVLEQALAREGGADEPGTSADEQSHARIIPALAARYPARPSRQSGIPSTSSRSEASADHAGRGAGRRICSLLAGSTAQLDLSLAEDLPGEAVP